MSAQMEALKDACVAALDEKYDLVFVDYRDSLSDEQVSSLICGDTDSLFDSADEWLPDNKWDGAKYEAKQVLDEVIRDWENRDDRDYSELKDEFEDSPEWDHLMDCIQERDSSDPIKDLAGHTSAVLCRTVIVGVDNCYRGRDHLTVSMICRDLGIKRNKHNVAVLREILGEAAHSEAYLMASIVYAVSPGDVWEMPYDTEEVDVVDPHLWLGNLMEGDGWCAGPLDGTFRIKRKDLRTDKDAPGYGWGDVTGGVYVGAYEATINAVPLSAEKEGAA